MNYGDISPPPPDGYGIELTHSDYIQIIDLRSCSPNFTIDVVNLKTSSNINVPGRWVIPTSLESNFSCSYPSRSSGESTITRGGCSSAHGALYPFGSAAGDTVIPHVDSTALASVSLLQPFPYFNRTYRHILIHDREGLALGPWFSPNEDVIAPFTTEFNYTERGNISYQQYTSGDVLHTATRDINSYFPNVTFTATWVFVVTWDRVVYWYFNSTENNDQNATATFQAVLISDDDLSFVLMNYGDISQPPEEHESGYSHSNFTQIIHLKSCFPNEIIDVADLQISSNINVPGRWVIPASLKYNFTCSYSSGPIVPTPKEPDITQTDRFDNV
ncbi:sushi, nidogen and EGF-like domain-containing protein 1 [Engraulis encrasicolus]|uniref:sushi, nidogen and EGF-like domain-containing protein 1 n=1 Tax=Engraulis encrasicolus TaxID=184585 RepID=UPI002FCE9BC2